MTLLQIAKKAAAVFFGCVTGVIMANALSVSDNSRLAVLTVSTFVGFLSYILAATILD